MSNLTQKLTYQQTWINSIDISGSVPDVGASYIDTEKPVTASRTIEANGTELAREVINVTGAVDDLIVCDVETATQCFAYLEADSKNTDGVTISYVDEAGTSTDIAVLYAGQSIFLPFLVSITPSSGDNCKLTGTALADTQLIYVSASHNG
jgi:hypothetical protein